MKKGVKSMQAMTQITELTVRGLRDRLDAGDLSAEEAARAYLEKIETEDPAIHAYLTVTAEETLSAGRRV